MRALLTDFQGRAIRFPEERWQHIIAEHPEMIPIEYVISETLLDPDEIYWDPDNPPEEVKLYYRWFYGLPLGDQRIGVAVRVFDHDAFVMTAHIASHVKGDDLIWTKPNA